MKARAEPGVMLQTSECSAASSGRKDKEGSSSGNFKGNVVVLTFGQSFFAGTKYPEEHSLQGRTIYRGSHVQRLGPVPSWLSCF